MAGSKSPPTIRRLLLPFCLAWVGAVGGLYWGGGATMTAGNGVAGSPSVPGSAALGLALGALIGLLATWRLPAQAVRSVFLVALAGAVSAGAIVADRIERGRQARTMSAEIDTAAQTVPFSASAVSHRPDDGSAFVEIAVDGARDTFVMTPRHHPGRPECLGIVAAARHVALLEAVRTADARIARNTSPCTPIVGDVIRTVRWSLPERGGHPREVQLTAACAGVYAEFDGLFAALDSLAFSAAATDGALTCAAPASAPD
jgi:hypothetical protein